MSHIDLEMLLTRALWQIPWVLMAIAMIGLALVKRDGRTWWKLLAAAGAVQLIDAVWGLIQTAFMYQVRPGLYWVWSIPSLLLGLISLGLLVGAAVVDRGSRSRNAAPGTVAPTAPPPYGRG